MARARRIQRSPTGTNFFLVDANFLANRYLDPARITDPREQQRVRASREWWAEIDSQLRKHKAIIYVPDVCIAEAFKVLAFKYYRDGLFRFPVEYKRARDKLSDDLHVSPKSLKAMQRRVRFHDLSTSRDIIIAVDRFFETFMKKNLNVSVPDLLILATAKYLIDFFHVPRESLYIVTLDNALWRGSKLFPDVPSAFNPNTPNERAARVFA